jgi:hypothetical protein
MRAFQFTGHRRHGRSDVFFLKQKRAVVLPTTLKSIKKDRGLWFAHGPFKALCCSSSVFYPQAHLSMMTCHHQPLVFELEKYEIGLSVIRFLSPPSQ